MKKVLITGASSGLGLASTKLLCRAGHHVYAGVRDIHKKNKDIIKFFELYSSEHKGTISPFEIDLSLIDSLPQQVQVLKSKTEYIDVLINNAGLGALGLIEETTIEQAKKLFDVNLFAPIELSKLCIPLLLKSEFPKIINVTSAGGRLNFPLLSYYCGSKYAFEAISESMALEFSDLGIVVHIVEPGSFSTNLHKNRMENKGEIKNKYTDILTVKDKMLNGVANATESNSAHNREPMEFAKLILELLSCHSKQLRYVVGSVATDGISEINQLTDKHQVNLFAKFGL